MEISDIKIEQINSGRFSFGRSIANADENSPLSGSIKKIGITTPLTLVDNGSGFDLVDGFKRFLIAGDLKMESVPAIVLNVDTCAEELCRLVAIACMDRLQSSSVATACFIKFLLGETIDEQVIIKTFMPLCGLKPNKKLYNDLLLISALPNEIIDYSEKRKVSAKNMRVICSAPAELLDYLLIDNDFGFSSSQFIEIVESCNDLMKRKNISATQLLSETFFCSEKKEKPDRNILLASLRALRSPVTTATRKMIENTKNEIAREINIDYDKSLEKEGVVIKLDVRNIESFDALVSKLSNATTRTGIEKILGLL